MTPPAATVAAVLPDATALDRLRVALARGATLVEPRPRAGVWDWEPVDGAEPVPWNAPRPPPSVKRFFFPAREALLHWRGDTAVEATPPAGRLVLFGLRPCDLAALGCQDRFFARDPWYRRRREPATIVAVNCLDACPGGFCRDLAAGPFADGGFDLLLTPLPDGRVVVASGGARGSEALERARFTARPLDAATGAAIGVARAAAEATFPARPFIAAAIARLNANPGRTPIAETEWQALGPACFACTGCTNVCPTCSCFTVVDEPASGGALTNDERTATDGPPAAAAAGTRARYWDSCLLEGFQREASRHNPSPTAGDRVRRFWYHKLSDDFADELGRRGCVGCGRCDVACLGAIGATNVLAALGRRA